MKTGNAEIKSKCLKIKSGIDTEKSSTGGNLFTD